MSEQYPDTTAEQLQTQQLNNASRCVEAGDEPRSTGLAEPTDEIRKAHGSATVECDARGTGWLPSPSARGSLSLL